ncbi:MAG: quinol:electron acceptor oxidoreductase subunit ActD, partial [Bacteroidota bacterium]
SVLCGAHGMAITYLLRNGTLPGMPASNPDPRTTDDKFVMEIVTGQNAGMTVEDLESRIRGTEVFELSIKEY